MEIKYQKPNGMNDIYEDISLWRQMEELIREQCKLFGYQEIRTPIVEYEKVFAAKNDSSDMVNKEMYAFEKGNERYVLRPEGTKGVIRSFVEKKLYGRSAEFPFKLFYMGPMFRHDRPQKGRYRQFHQFGVEAIGVRNPYLDAETIALGYSIVEKLGIKNVVIQINTLGDSESRNAYREALKEYFKDYLSELCEDCQRRYQQNPLRILDCKADKNHPCMANAPKCRDYLNQSSKDYFEQVLKALDQLQIPYEINDRLVRGLDYYTNTVFEAVPVDDQGQQSTVFAGGQYDGLVDSFGGGDLCGFGFGMGMERMIELAADKGLLQNKTEGNDAYIITLGDVSDYGLKIADMLRKNGYSTEMEMQSRSLKAQFKAADRFLSKAIIIVGEDEKNNGTLQFKNCATKEQNSIKLDELLNKIKEIRE